MSEGLVLIWTNLVEASAVQQGRQLVQTGLWGVEQVLDTQQVPLRRTRRRKSRCSVIMGAQEGQRPASGCVRYLGCGEERHSKLQQALDLDLHGGQWPLEDGQRLQVEQLRVVSIFFKLILVFSAAVGPLRATGLLEVFALSQEVVLWPISRARRPPQKCTSNSFSKRGLSSFPRCFFSLYFPPHYVFVRYSLINWENIQRKIAALKKREDPINYVQKYSCCFFIYPQAAWQPWLNSSGLIR